MKTALLRLFCFAVLLPGFLNAQVWTRGYHGQIDLSEFLIKSQYGVDAVFPIIFPSRYTGVIRYDLHGNKLFEKQIQLTVKRPAATTNGGLFLAGTQESCDTPPPTTNKYLLLLDSTGNTIGTYSFISTYYTDYMPVTVCPDSGLIVVADTLLLKFDRFLNFKKKQSLSIKHVSWVGYTPHGLMISGKSGTQCVFQRLDTGFHVVSTIPTPTVFQYRDAISLQKAIYCSTNGVGYKVYNDSIVGGTVYGNTPHVFGDSIVSLTKNKLFISDTLGNLVKTYISGDTSTKFTEALAVGDTLYHTSYQMGYVQKMLGAFTEKSYQVNVTKAHRSLIEPGTNDLAITSILAINTQTSLGTFGSLITGTIAIAIKNKSNHPIHAYRLNTYWYYDIFCSGVFEQRTYTTTIQPAGTHTIVEIWTTGLPPPSQFFDPSSYEKCFFLSLPNEETDIHRDDNEGCVLLSIVGMEENKLSTSIRIYPVPAQNEMQLRSEQVIKSIHVIDISGKLLSYSSPFSNTVTLNSRDWPNGIYFLKVETESGTAHLKFLVQH